MKLRVFETLETTLRFSLRHFLAFYLLCLLAGMPSFLYVLYSGQSQPGLSLFNMGWKGDLLTGFEIVLRACVSATMVWTLVRDRRNESWTVIPAISDALGRLPTILGVGLSFGVGSIALSILTELAGRLQPLGTIISFLATIVLALMFIVAMPRAAVGNGGVVDCFSRSISLTAGSRLRIMLVFVLLGLPLGLAIYIVFMIGLTVVQPYPQQLESLLNALIFLASPVLYVFLIAAPVAIHEQLAEMKDGMEFGEAAAVFD